jgi:hypothetical protein
MGVAHTYAELELSVLKLKDELKFVATGRLIAEVIIIAGGEPRLRIGDHQLSEEHAGRLAIWIQRVFEREKRDRSGAVPNQFAADQARERTAYNRYDDSSHESHGIRRDCFAGP